jgi:hypothetical protein
VIGLENTRRTIPQNEREEPAEATPGRGIMSCRWPLCFLLLSLLAAVRTARAEEPTTVVWLPGAAREIPTTTSASRDAPVSALAYGPRVRGDLAGDLGIIGVRWSALELRFGARGMIEIEHSEPGLSGPLPLPGEGKGPMLWRGLFGISVAFSDELLGRRWFGERGAIEFTLSGGHESDHLTAPGPAYLDPPQPGDILEGGGGNYIGADLAVRFEAAPRWEIVLRLEDHVYWNGPLLNQLGGDAILRWRATGIAQPTVALFGEHLFADHTQNAANDGGSATALAGLALPGQLGEVTPFVSVQSGNAKGLLINRRETSGSVGVRYSPF